ncbi:carboxypeptidase-like regulatory domain-containing protein [Hymenobacter sp. BT491]|uniref:carboxypeptidase-like regulatory domain-containing protein n=1 Tax=Hymenobacter sp. BT491 TaxID=2766779 RepID=UPI0016534A7D|nr:carboxypeptidase-like regulatory domain-containing protein [Hymenobacter sp. BT491]MBC6990352.1 carboxypeptidase-like regulatory domain-containing protein [Hymenobacter sp. BT491]
MNIFPSQSKIQHAFVHPGKLPAAFCLVVLLFVGLSHSAQAQYQLHGTVIDKDTQQPLPFASIGVKNTGNGTASNENGEFVLNLKSLPQTLIVSELAHVRDTVRITSVDKPIQIALGTATIALPEVKVGSYAFQLVDRAYRQMQKNYDKKFYGKAFYRQVTRINDEPTELQEVVWNVKSNNARIEGTDIAQGRYAAKPSLMNFSNFSLYTKSYGLYDAQADSTKSLALLSPNLVKNYYLELVGILEQGEGGIAEIKFETRPELTKYHAEGTIWLDVDTYKVVRFKIATPNFTANASNPAYKFKNTKLEFDMAFQNSEEPASPLDYIKTNLTFDILQPGKPVAKMNVSSFTFFYETSETPADVSYAKVSTRDRDLEAIKSTKYDPEFWANNSVVKRTPLEDEVIESFEQKGAFGTMVPPKAKSSK